MFRRALGVAVAAVAALMCGPTAAQSAAPLTIIDPPDGSTVRGAAPLMLRIAAPDVPSAPGRTLNVVVSVDGRIVAQTCSQAFLADTTDPGRALNVCEVVATRITRTVPPGRALDIGLAASSPMVAPGDYTPAPGSTNWTPRGAAGPAARAGMGGFYASNVAAPFGGALGRPAPGTHTVEVTVWDSAGPTDAPIAIARGTSTFTVAAPRLSVLYENTLPLRRITQAPGSDRSLTVNRGAIVQQNERRFDASGATKITGKTLIVKSEAEIAATIQKQIRKICAPKGRFSGNPQWFAAARAHCATSGLVFIDEITPEFADWDAATVAERGRPGPGTRLARAMRRLDTKSPWGFTWASRVHMYLSPTVMLDLANQAQSPRSYAQIGPAFARSGGIWMEMYRGSAGFGARAFTEAEWRTAPAGVNALVKRYGGSTSRLHYLITRAPKVQQVEDRYGKLCASPMACQWALGEETSLGRQIMANGVGAYRVSDQATAWLREYNRRFTD
jgi:hypothetical protein